MTGPVRKTIYSPRYERLLSLLLSRREAAGLTQVELAAALNRPQSFVSKYERGERRLDVEEFLQVATALGADPVKIIRALLRDSHED